MTNIERFDADDPASDARVAAVLSAAAAPVEPGPLPGEQAALAAFGAVHHRSGRKHMRTSLVPFKAGLAAAVSAGVLLTGGVAAASTGTLPGAAQQTAKDVLSHVGITVPGPDDHAGDHPAQRGTSADHTPSTAGNTDGTTTQTSTDEPDSTDGHGKGSTISPLAKSKDTTGIKKGQLVSTTASGGKSQAGQHGQAGEHPAPSDHPSSSDHSQAGEHPADHQVAGSQGQASTKGLNTAATAGSAHGAGQGARGADHRP